MQFQAGRSDDLEWLSNRFCALPWTMAEIHADGSVFVCCPRYSGEKKIGNIYKESALEIWNSKEAQFFRKGILDGTFAMCHFRQCPQISGRHLPDKDSIQDVKLRTIIENAVVINELGPFHVKLAHDDSCNLSCPSCRDKVIVAKRAKQIELDRVLKAFILPFLVNCKSLELSGDGDPFASKHYRDILTYTHVLYPKMKISLHTNGVLCDAENWRNLHLDNRIASVQVSIDAASERTYDIVRRGGSWKRLQENLGFLKQNRAEGNISKLTLAFVVQVANYREMADFVKLAQSVAADEVNFSLIYDWKRAAWGKEFSNQKVWDQSHPLFWDFVNSLSDPIFDDKIVQLGDVENFRNIRSLYINRE